MEYPDLELKEEQKEFLTLLGFLYLRYGKWEKARVLFEALQLLYPADPYFARSLSYAYLNLEEYRSALKQAEKLLETARDMGVDEAETACFLKSRALWGLGDQEKARKCIAELLDMKTKGGDAEHET